MVNIIVNNLYAGLLVLFIISFTAFILYFFNFKQHAKKINKEIAEDSIPVILALPLQLPKGRYTRIKPDGSKEELSDFNFNEKCLDVTLLDGTRKYIPLQNFGEIIVNPEKTN